MSKVQGYFDPRFESVREVFAEQLNDEQARGAALCVTVGGETVLDVWGGVVDKDDSQVAAGRIELDVPLADVWPEFAAAGKEAVTLRHVLSHRSGMSAISQTLPPEALFDWQAMCDALIAQSPWWTPGEAHGYAPLTYSWLLGEPLRRLSGQSPGAYVQDHICQPLGMDFFVGAPDAELSRIAHVSRLRNQFGDDYAKALFMAMGKPEDLPFKAFANPSSLLTSTNRVEWQQAELLAANGSGNARSLARFWQVMAHGGQLDGVKLLDEELVTLMQQEHSQGLDRTLRAPTRFGLGVMLEQNYEGGSFGMGANAYGHPGAGGTLGFCDPDAKVGFGYATNAMGPYVLMDPRATALSRAVYAALRSCD